MQQPEQFNEAVKSFEVLQVDKDEHSLRLSARVPADLHYFGGHFDGNPVVAGVVQLKWVDEAIQQYFGVQPDLAGMEAVKFHRLLFPNSTFNMIIKHQPDTGKWSYQITTADGKVASGRLVTRDGGQGV